MEDGTATIFGMVQNSARKRSIDAFQALADGLGLNATLNFVETKNAAGRL